MRETQDGAGRRVQWARFFGPLGGRPGTVVQMGAQGDRHGGRWLGSALAQRSARTAGLWTLQFRGGEKLVVHSRSGERAVRPGSPTQADSPGALYSRRHALSREPHVQMPAPAPGRQGMFVEVLPVPSFGARPSDAPDEVRVGLPTDPHGPPAGTAAHAADGPHWFRTRLGIPDGPTIMTARLSLCARGTDGPSLHLRPPRHRERGHARGSL